jgi:hypothetical protein
MRLQFILILTIQLLLPGQGRAEDSGGDKWAVIEPVVTYGESLDSVERKLRGLGLRPVVLPSTAIDPESLRTKFGVTLSEEEADQIMLHGISLDPDIGIYFGFNHKKKLAECLRRLSVTKDQYGKSVREVFIQRQYPDGKTEVPHKEEASDSKSAAMPSPKMAELVSRIEDSVKFGESTEAVQAKLKKFELDPLVVYVGFVTPEQIEENKKKEVDEQFEKSLENGAYYRIDMVDSFGVSFDFNYYKKLIRYDNTHHYNSKMNGKRFSEVQADLQAKATRP